MKQKFVFIITLMFISLSIIYSNSFDFGGYYKTFFSYIPVSNINNKTESGVNQKVRLDFKKDLSSNIKIDFSYELITSIESSYFQKLNINKNSYRIGEEIIRLFPDKKSSIGNWFIEGDLDRLYSEIYFPFGDLYIGRQAISWGSGHVINPTDIFLSYSFSSLDKEEKTGVDAARLRIPLGMMSEVDVGAVFGKDFKKENNAYFSRFKFYVDKTDLYFLLMFFRNNMLYGLNLTRPLKGAGTWIEMAYVENNVFENVTSLEKSYFRLSAGFDYYFSSDNYIIVEYHLNTAGENSPDEYDNIFMKNSYKEGNVYLLGKNYLNFVHSYQFTGLLESKNSLIYNLSDNSFCINPSLEYNIADNIYLAGGIYFYDDIFNEKEEKEFEKYNDLVYTSFRIYF